MKKDTTKKPKTEKRKNWEKSYREKNKQRLRDAKKRFREHQKDIVFNHYGNKCDCCGESNRIFFTIDHIMGRNIDEKWARKGLTTG